MDREASGVTSRRPVISEAVSEQKLGHPKRLEGAIHLRNVGTSYYSWKRRFKAYGCELGWLWYIWLWHASLCVCVHTHVQMYMIF